MSLESQLEALNVNLSNLVNVIRNQSPSAAPSQSTIAPTPQPAPQMNQTPPPNVGQQMPMPTLPQMPAPPTFQAPQPAPVQAPGVPFTDAKGLMDYVMSAYKAFGPVKGAKIQGVLGTLGYANIGDVKPEHYAQFHAGVENLRSQP